MNDQFRAIAKALQPYISNTYDLLNAADAVMQVTYNAFPDPAALRVREVTPELIKFASTNVTILDYLNRTQKIMAIKELRTATGCGLKAAKDAVEHTDTSVAALRYKLTGVIRH